MTDVMRQEAPFPHALADIVDRLRPRAGVTVTLEDVDRGQGSKGLTLCVLIEPIDSYHEGKVRPVMHYMIVPPAAYDWATWNRWVRDQLAEVSDHEECEFYRLEMDDGTLLRPFAPLHGPGKNPYVVHEYADDVDRRTSFRGEVKAE